MPTNEFTVKDRTNNSRIRILVEANGLVSVTGARYVTVTAPYRYDDRGGFEYVTADEQCDGAIRVVAEAQRDGSYRVLLHSDNHWSSGEAPMLLLTHVLPALEEIRENGGQPEHHLFVRASSGNGGEGLEHVMLQRPMLPQLAAL